MPPSPVEISHKKDGRQRQPHRFHVSCPPYQATGSDAVVSIFLLAIVLYKYDIHITSNNRSFGCSISYTHIIHKDILFIYIHLNNV